MRGSPGQAFPRFDSLSNVLSEQRCKIKTVSSGKVHSPGVQAAAAKGSIPADLKDVKDLEGGRKGCILRRVLETSRIPTTTS